MDDNKKWLLLSDLPMSGLDNMNRDRELLERAITLGGRPILRFYRFMEPTITIGYHQKMSTMKETGDIPIVRRPTGGRAIYHDQELTYSVVIPKGHPITSMSITQSYGLISSALLYGLNLLGIDAEFLPGEIGYMRSASCFASSSKYEIATKEGRKFIGSAQKRKQGALLQQGSILTGPSYKKICLYTTKPANDKGISISEILDRNPRRLEIERHLTRGFEAVLNAHFSPMLY